MKKLIRYRLSISRTFPATHKRKGENTFFVEKILKGQKKILSCYLCDERHICKNHWKIVSINFEPKIHTIRGNYDLWAKRFEKINKGEAVLELYYWSGKPYNSKCVTICQLDKNDGIGVQKIIFDCGEYSHVYLNNEAIEVEVEALSKNDGLNPSDFEDWFKKYDLSKPLAIIQFTDFRY